MTLQDVVAHYEARIRELQVAINEHGGANSLLLAILAAGMFVVLGLSAIRGELSWIFPVLPVPVVAYGIYRFLASQKKQFRDIRLRRYYDRAIQRVNGEWMGGITGDEFTDPDHVYANDLNCFGEGSLFQLLCTARTAIGRRRLADYLTDAPPVAETLLRQDAVRELQTRPDLRDKISVLGDYEFLESRPQTFEDWLELPTIDFPKWFPMASVFVLVVFAALVAAGILGLASWRTLAMFAIPGAAFHTAIGMLYRERVNPMVAAVRPLSAETRVLWEGLRLLEGQSFQCAKLTALVEQVRGSASAIAKLERPLALLEHRDKDGFYPVTRFLMLGTQACAALETWRREHGQDLLAWVHAWAELEALAALATYSFENPGHVFPEFSPQTCFVGKGLGHPLLNADGCVVNDVDLNAKSPFYVVSGSNMSGKSTLLRTVGLNAVLAYAGAPVRATKLRMSGLSIVASLSVGDSLLQGRSKFKAEVDRLRQAIETKVEGRPVLFLVDEIFSGTNSRDRRVAAEAVVRTLVKRGAIGALSTHDLALAEIAGAPVGLGGINVHMGSRDGSDPMDFDYRLKLGVTTEANALAIARMAGVPV